MGQLATMENQLQSKRFGHIPSQTILSPQEENMKISNDINADASAGVIDFSDSVVAIVDFANMAERVNSVVDISDLVNMAKIVDFVVDVSNLADMAEVANSVAANFVADISDHVNMAKGADSVADFLDPTNMAKVSTLVADVSNFANLFDISDFAELVDFECMCDGDKECSICVEICVAIIEGPKVSKAAESTPSSQVRNQIEAESIPSSQVCNQIVSHKEVRRVIMAKREPLIAYPIDMLLSVCPSISNLPIDMDKLLEEFQDVFPKDIYLMEHHINLTLVATLPNRATYRTNLEEAKEI
ncbi:hypothetical protein CR513_02682, partial [Mucuna pruriens]